MAIRSLFLTLLLVGTGACTKTNDVTDPNAIDTVSHDGTLTGEGTDDSPLALADDSVTSDQIVDGTVNTSELADEAVTTAKLSNQAVTTAKLADGNVGNAKLAADAVTTDKIADGTIDGDDLAASSVGTANLADASVTNAKLASGIDASKLTGTVNGATVAMTGPLPVTSAVYFVDSFSTTGFGGAGAEYGVSCASACATKYGINALCLAAFLNVSNGSQFACSNADPVNRKRCLCTFAP